ncbi:hypothetical protein LXL04_019316 [Taraxacum kok-saghyz]
MALLRSTTAIAYSIPRRYYHHQHRSQKPNNSFWRHRNEKGKYLGINDKIRNKEKSHADHQISGMNIMLGACTELQKLKRRHVPLYKHIADLSGRGNYVLPVPTFTLINVGKHVGNNLALRDIIVLPIGAKRFEEAMQMGSETYHHLKAVITEKFGAQGCNVGEDRGFEEGLSIPLKLAGLQQIEGFM